MQQADIDVRDFALQVRLGPLDRCLAEALAIPHEGRRCGADLTAESDRLLAPAGHERVLLTVRCRRAYLRRCPERSIAACRGPGILLAR